MSKFKVGEIAIYVGNSGAPSMARFINQEATVVDPLAVRPHVLSRYSHLPRYGIKFSNGLEAWVLETSLRKKRPPEQPSAFSYDEIISMCNDKSITDIRPTETQSRQGLKGILQPSGESHGS